MKKTIITPIKSDTEILDELKRWVTKFGVELCPGTRADTYGEGMSAAKETIRRIIYGR